MKTLMCDLHMHSVYSDGNCTPKELSVLASEAGAQVVALSDHDAVEGVAEMCALCKAINIINIPAAEFSSFESCDVHILGYGINTERADLRRFLKEMEEAKIQRIGRILDKLSNNGMPLEFKEVRAFAKHSLSRAHVAQAMAARGYESNVQDCFNNWLKEGGVCHVPNTKARPQEIIKLIHESGGVAVLAHPIRLKLTENEKAVFIAKLAKAGLDGLEAEYKNSPKEAVDFFKDIAAKNKLFVTNGGDFHNVALNRIIPRPLPKDVVDRLM